MKPTEYKRVRSGIPVPLELFLEDFRPENLHLKHNECAGSFFSLRDYDKESRPGYDDACRQIEGYIAGHIRKHLTNPAILDIGCLAGVRTKLIRDRYAGSFSSLYGVDLVDKREEANMDGMNFSVCNLMEGRLPYNDSFFDGVFLLQVLGNLPPKIRKGILSEISRVLKPGGMAYVQVTGFPYSKESAPKMYKDCVGFGYELGDYFTWLVSNTGQQLTEPVINSLFSKDRFANLIKGTGLRIHDSKEYKVTDDHIELLYVLGKE